MVHKSVQKLKLQWNLSLWVSSNEKSIHVLKFRSNSSWVNIWNKQEQCRGRCVSNLEESWTTQQLECFVSVGNWNFEFEFQNLIQFASTCKTDPIDRRRIPVRNPLYWKWMWSTIKRPTLLSNKKERIVGGLNHLKSGFPCASIARHLINNN